MWNGSASTRDCVWGCGYIIEFINYMQLDRLGWDYMSVIWNREVSLVQRSGKYHICSNGSLPQINAGLILEAWGSPVSQRK